MARYKSYDYNQSKLIPVYFADQIRPGTFDPAILLKILLFAYSHGITSSRKIEAACQNNILFKALSADTMPHFTTIAEFISTMEKEITLLFRNVLSICDEMGLIGKEMFAIDGCKLPSNASKEWSGTKADFAKKKEKADGDHQAGLCEYTQHDEIRSI